LSGFSNDQVRIYNSSVCAGKFQATPNIIEISKIDNPRKVCYNQLLEVVKRDLSDELYRRFDDEQKSNCLGPLKEGCVVDMGPIGSFKITSNYFKELMHDSRQRRAA